MTSHFSEQDLASMEGPRAMREPGSPEWCWQTVSALQHMWNSLIMNYDRYITILGEADEYRVWEKVPYDDPFGTREEMLKQVEIGDGKDAQRKMRIQTLAAQARELQKRGADHPIRTKPRNSSEQMMSLIATEHPDILQRIADEEFATMIDAARAAGIERTKPRKTVTLSDNVDRVADTLKSYYTPEQIRRIRERLV